MTLKGRADPQGLTIERLDAKCGLASIMLAMNRSGWTANAPLAASAKISGLTLTEKLETSLPESQARIWKRFRPMGDVDADIRLTFDGENWKPTVTATCRGISLTDTQKFPYTLAQTTGQVVYLPAEKGQSDQLRLDLTGYGGGRPVKIVAQLTHLAPEEPDGPSMGESVASDGTAKPANAYSAGYRGARYARGRTGLTHPVGFVEISGTDIPLHEQLLLALPPKAEDLVRTLRA